MPDKVRIVAPEEALVTDARQRFAVAGDFATFLQLDQLMQTLFPGTVRASRRPVFSSMIITLSSRTRVVLVALEHMQRRQRLPHQLLAPARAVPQPAERSAAAHRASNAAVG